MFQVVSLYFMSQSLHWEYFFFYTIVTTYVNLEGMIYGPIRILVAVTRCTFYSAPHKYLNC